MISWIFFLILSLIVKVYRNDLSNYSIIKWKNLHNQWLTKYFLAPLYVIPAALKAQAL